jgi:hypothetical protein
MATIMSVFKTSSNSDASLIEAECFKNILKYIPFWRRGSHEAPSDKFSTLRTYRLPETDIP